MERKQLNRDEDIPLCCHPVCIIRCFKICTFSNNNSYKLIIILVFLPKKFNRAKIQFHCGSYSRDRELPGNVSIGVDKDQNGSPRENEFVNYLIDH